MIRAALLFALLLPTPALALSDERRDCTFDTATFEGSPPQKIRQTVKLKADLGNAKIHVARGRVWRARVTYFSDGSEEYVFNTKAAREKIEISPRGMARWTIAYTGRKPGKNPVTGYSGRCAGWRPDR